MIGIRGIRGIRENTYKGNGIAFGAEYQTVYDYFPTKPDSSVATEQNIMVQGWVDDGVWIKDDVRYVTAGHTNDDGESQVNWNNPGTYDITLVNAPSFVNFEGFTTDGTDYLDTNFNLNADSVNYTLNGGHIFHAIGTDVLEGKWDCGVRDAGAAGTSMIAARNGGLFYGVINATGIVSSAGNSNSIGIYTVIRTASNNTDTYKNKTILGSRNTASQVLASHNMTIGCLNDAGVKKVFATKQYAGFAMGATLNSSEKDSEVDRFESYMDSNGKGLIP